MSRADGGIRTPGCALEERISAVVHRCVGREEGKYARLCSDSTRNNLGPTVVQMMKKYGSLLNFLAFSMNPIKDPFS